MIYCSHCWFYGKFIQTQFNWQANKYTTAPNDEHFMSKIIINAERSTLSSEQFDWYAVVMYEMTSLNLLFQKEKMFKQSMSLAWDVIAKFRQNDNFVIGNGNDRQCYINRKTWLRKIERLRLINGMNMWFNAIN